MLYVLISITPLRQIYTVPSHQCMIPQWNRKNYLQIILITASYLGEYTQKKTCADQGVCVCVCVCEGGGGCWAMTGHPDPLWNFGKNVIIGFVQMGNTGAGFIVHSHRGTHPASLPMGKNSWICTWKTSNKLLISHSFFNGSHRDKKTVPHFLLLSSNVPDQIMLMCSLTGVLLVCVQDSFLMTSPLT